MKAIVWFHLCKLVHRRWFESVAYYFNVLEGIHDNCKPQIFALIELTARHVIAEGRFVFPLSAVQIFGEFEFPAPDDRRGRFAKHRMAGENIGGCNVPAFIQLEGDSDLALNSSSRSDWRVSGH